MTITTVRPTADALKSGVTLSTGTSAFALVDDSPTDDATYITAPAGTQYPPARVLLDMPDNTLGITATKRIYRIRFRARIRMDATDGGRSASLALQVRDRRFSGYSYAQEKFSTASTTVAEFTGIWRTVPSAQSGKIIEQSDFNNYQIDMRWYNSGGGSKRNVRCTEVYCDADIRDIGTASAVTVTGAAASSQPLVSWTWTPNTEGDPALAYEVRVFSAAQYGAAGFDPSKVTPVWGSGVVRSDSTATQVGAATATDSGALILGTTYQAYVKVSQSYNGQDWWIAAWVISSPFAVTSTPPSTPTLTVEPDPRKGELRNICKVSLLGMNLLGINQSSFEGGLGDGGFNWAAAANCTVTQSATQALHGAFSMRLSSTAAGNMSAASPGGVFGLRVRAGVQYTALASFRAGASARSCRVLINWLTRAGGAISTSTGSNVTDSTSAWTQGFVTATAPATAAYAQVQVDVLSTAAGAELHYVDQCALHFGSSTTWSMGGYIAGPGSSASVVVEYAWSSVLPGNYAHQSLVGGGEWLNRNTDGWYTTGTNSFMTFDTGERYFGDGCIRWDVLDTTAEFYIGTAPTGPGPIGNTTSLPAVPGDVYTFSCWVKADASFSSAIVLQAVDRNFTTVGSAVTKAVTITTGWVRVFHSITVPAGACYVRPSFQNTGAVTDRRVWFDGVQWEMGQAMTPFISQGGGTLASFRPIRGAEPGDVETALTVDFEGIYYIHDHEVPPGYHVTYRAYTTFYDVASDTRLSSDVTPYVTTLLDPPGGDFDLLKDPVRPVNRLPVQVTEVSEAREEQVGVFYPLRPGTWWKEGQRPVVVSDYVGGVDGELSIVLSNEDEWRVLSTLLRTPGALWLASRVHGGKYIRFTNRAVTRQVVEAGRYLRTVRVSYLEVDRPGGQLL